MRVSRIRIEASPYGDQLVRVAADISYENIKDEKETLWFDVPSEFADRLKLVADPWFAALLPLASKLGERLVIEAEIDPFLYEARRELVEWWQFWLPRYR